MKTHDLFADIAKGEYTAIQIFATVCAILDETTITRIGDVNGVLYTEPTDCPLAPEQKIRVARVFEEAFRLAATRYKDQAITSAIRHCPTGGTYTLDGMHYAVTVKHGDRPDELHITLTCEHTID